MILTTNDFTTELTTLIDEVAAKATIEWVFDYEPRQDRVKGVKAYTKQVKVGVYSRDELIDTIDTFNSDYTIEDNITAIKGDIAPKDFYINFKDKIILIYY